LHQDEDQCGAVPAIKTLEDFTFARLPTAPTEAIAHLATTTFLARTENVILRGLGTGETHFSIGLGTTRMRETRVSDAELVHHWRRGPRRAWASALSSWRSRSFAPTGSPVPLALGAALGAISALRLRPGWASAIPLPAAGTRVGLLNILALVP
jgi:hypothetical protein